jgi:hypothetical protein
MVSFADPVRGHLRKVDTMSPPMVELRNAGLAGDSMTTSKRRRSGRCSTTVRASAAVARDVDLTETALRGWVKRALADRSQSKTGLTTAEREELARLRKEKAEGLPA